MTMKVFIYPPNSMILQDLVERFGHTPLALAKEIERRVNDPELDSPPMNITEIDVKIGLKYAAIEVPSGVRGRLAMFGPLIDEAEAAIIVNNRIKSARCILPVSSNNKIPIDLGLRHRAAIGITERTDAIALIVSEETGEISVAKEGTLVQNIRPAQVKDFLEKEFAPHEAAPRKRKVSKKE